MSQEITCFKCHIQNPATYNFCGNCGEPLYATATLRKVDIEAAQAAQGASGEGRVAPKPVERRMVVGACMSEPIEVQADRPLTIGRDRINDIVIPALFVSRYHAEIRRDGQGTIIRDMGSRNGTLVNGKPTTSATLADGDRIGIGVFDLFYREMGPGEKEENLDYPRDFAVNLNMLSMREVIQLVVLNRKTGKLSIRVGGDESALYFQKGWIVNAMTPYVKGADAAREVIRASSGVVRFSDVPVAAPQIITDSPAQLVRSALNLD